jgi:fluoride exporter
MWQLMLAVAAGGAAGSVLRLLVTNHMLRVAGDFPFGTLIVNVVGSLLIGLFARLLAGPDVSTTARAALTVGFCGGFTTFSTYSAELVLLIEQGRAMRAMLYVVSSTTLALAATVAGLSLGTRLFPR